MKGVVAYDSVHGSTKAVAEAMAEEIRAEGHQVEIVSVKGADASAMTGDFLFVGSPTRGGKMTKEAEAFIESLDVPKWKGKPVVAFDTIGPLSKDADKRKATLEKIDTDWGKNAAAKIKELLEQRGLSCSKVMHFAVVGMWGPIAPEQPARAKELTKKFLSSL